MDIVPVTTDGEEELMDFEMEAVSIDQILKSQGELIHSQLENLTRIVIRQCDLTGVNPLSQEMVGSLNTFISIFLFVFETLGF